MKYEVEFSAKPPKFIKPEKLKNYRYLFSILEQVSTFLNMKANFHDLSKMAVFMFFYAWNGNYAEKF